MSDSVESPSSNVWLQRRVLNYAHQGGAREAPSSTLHAFTQSIANGATALEMDVHCTMDDVLVVCHDTSVDRTTNATGLIADLTWAELRDLDNSYWWVPGEEAVTDRPEAEYILRGRAPQDPTFGVALLADVLDAYRGVYLNLDIKSTAPAVPGYERQLADLLRAHDRVEDVIVASFHDVALQRFRAYAPEIATSMAMMESIVAGQAMRQGQLPEVTAGQVALQIPYWLHGVQVITAEMVALAHQANLAVHVWTIDEASEMHELLEMNVDAIITDKPSVLTNVLASR